MSISEQVKELRELAECYYSEIRHHASTITNAADTIEALSAKLQAANIENGSGWIACEDRLPDEDNVKVIVSAIWDGYEYTTESYFYHGRFYNKPYYQISAGKIQESYTGDKVVAWQPLPEPYRP